MSPHTNVLLILMFWLRFRLHQGLGVEDYWIEETNNSWEDAWGACIEKEGMLAVVDSQALFHTLIAEQLLNRSVWIGASDSALPGVYRWTNGRAITWTNWASKQPSRLVNEHCVAMDSEGWYDEPCDLTYPFLCQNITQDFYCGVTDLACAPWIQTAFEHPVRDTRSRCIGHDEYNITLPAGVDCVAICQKATHFICQSVEVGESSCRGSSQRQEEIEVVNCTDENTTTTLYHRTYIPAYESAEVKYTLKRLEQPILASWSDAVKACQYNKMHLLTLNSPHKDTTPDSAGSWISLTDENSRGVYRSTDSSYPLYLNFQPDSTFDTEGEATCAYKTTPGYWSHVKCTEPKPFVCEFLADEDPCVRLPCIQGTCENASNVFVCRCDIGFSGKYCDEKYDNCDTAINPLTGACYWIEYWPQSWHNAWTTCAKKNGILAVVDSKELYNYLFQGRFKVFTWLGASELAMPGVYRWTNGHAVSWTLWRHLQPDNNGGNEHCLATEASGWNDRPCFEEYQSICQSIPSDFYCAPTELSCAPWINVGFDTVQENKECVGHDEFKTGSDKIVAIDCVALCQGAAHFVCRSAEEGAECSGSSLTAAEIRAINCTRDKPHTDLHTRPYTPQYESEDVQYTLRTFQPRSTTWYRAAEVCRYNGMQLLTVKSPAKAELVDTYNSWLGMTDVDNVGSYHWQDGTYPVYHRWQNKNSRRAAGGRCAFMKNDGWWEDRNCSEIQPFICEYYTRHRCGTVDCHNGTCVEAVDSFVCNCQPGDYGQLCDNASSVRSVAEKRTDVRTSFSDCDCFELVVALSVLVSIFLLVDLALVVYIKRLRHELHGTEDEDKIQLETVTGIVPVEVEVEPRVSGMHELRLPDGRTLNVMFT